MRKYNAVIVRFRGDIAGFQAKKFSRMKLGMFGPRKQQIECLLDIVQFEDREGE